METRDKYFKENLRGFFERGFCPLEKIRYAFIELDTKKPKDRIEYPGYDKDAQMVGEYNPEYLPGFRSCVKVVLFINQCNRIGFSRKGKTRWVGEGFRDENGILFNEDIGDGGSYDGDIFLLIAKSQLSQNFDEKTDSEKLRELIDYTEYTVRQLDTWGYMPIAYEAIPEINGCLPEQICPHNESYLNRILKKIEAFGTVGSYIPLP